MDLEKRFEENMNLVPYVMKNLLHLSVSEDDFEDIKQEGYIELWKAINNYKEDSNSSFANYACICIKNGILGYLNSASRTKWNNVRNTALYFDESPASDSDVTFNDIIPSFESNDLELYVALKDILSQLDEDDLKTKVLRDRMNGLRYKEIAKKYNIKLKYVGVLLFEIREEIKNRLK